MIDTTTIPIEKRAKMLKVRLSRNLLSIPVSRFLAIRVRIKKKHPTQKRGITITRMWGFPNRTKKTPKIHGVKVNTNPRTKTLLAINSPFCWDNYTTKTKDNRQLIPFGFKLAAMIPIKKPLNACLQRSINISWVLLRLS